MSDETSEHEEEIAFIPFHAVNDFMNDDYRLSVIRSVSAGLDQLPGELRGPVDRAIRQVVRVPGFRNSAKAPAAVKARPMAEAFVKSPQLVSAVLAAWGEIHAGLRQNVYDLLTARGWELLPPQADRTQLPGFLTEWVGSEDFDGLYAAFQAQFPESQASKDDVSLMAVWLSGRLPYHGTESDVDSQAEG